MTKTTKQAPRRVRVVSTTVRLPNALRRRAKTQAAELGITLGAYVEKALRGFHESREPRA